MARIPGEFVPLDVGAPHDRAIRQAGPMAELLFYRSLMWARKNKTNGLIPDFDLATVAAGIPNPKRHAGALVRERLWIACKGGWHVRSWVKWNPTVDRAAQSSGGALGNHNRWHADGRWSPDCEFCGGPPDMALDLRGDSLTDRPTDRPTDTKPDIGTESPTDRSGSQRESKRERERDEVLHHSSSLGDARSSASAPDVPGETPTRMMPGGAR